MKTETQTALVITQGRWSVRQTLGHGFRIQSAGKIICWERQDNYEPQSEEQAQGNARLISASPDMYDALKELMEIRESYGIALPTSLKNKINNAISKAEGK